ncbi:MAG: uroporphyrinogen-III synthase [Burkholderiaceae bacterium]
MRLIVTRPQPDAQRWVRSLSDAGFDAIALPLIELSALADPTALQSCWNRLDQYQAVMFVSATAVEHFFDAQAKDASPSVALSYRMQPRAWATGPGTKAALLRCGVAASQIDAPADDARQFDSEALWQVLEPSLRSGERILLVRGTDGTPNSAIRGVGRDWLAQRLSHAGIQVDFVVAYQRGLPRWTPDQSQIASQAAVDGSLWIFSSSQAITHLQALLPQQSWAKAKALASHRRIAAAARAAGFSVVLESRPTLTDMVASIESIR